MSTIQALRLRVKSASDDVFGTIVRVATFSATVKWDDGELSDVPFSKLQNASVELCPICGVTTVVAGHNGKCVQCWTEAAINS